MGIYRLSTLAETDVANIYRYGILTFGLGQAKTYLTELEGAFQVLADRPELGRSAFELANGLRRFSFESHIIFYQPSTDGILVIRVLHHSMNTEIHL